MPIFDWSCDTCNDKVEKISKHDDVIVCEKCGSIRTKVISAPGHFEFYGPNATSTMKSTAQKMQELNGRKRKKKKLYYGTN